MNIIKYNTKREPWTKLEDEIIFNELKEKGHISFQHLIDKNRYKFHPSRTVRSLEAHFYRLKRAGEFEAFEKSTVEEEEEKKIKKSKIEEGGNQEDEEEVFENVEEIMDEIVEKKISTKIKKSEILKEKRESKQAIKLEKEHYINQLNSSNIDISNPIFAELIGEKKKFKITKIETFLGRKGKKNNCQIDIELSKTGNLQTSKQQATIELQKTITNSFQFLLKNQGRKSIFVNDFEVLFGSEKYINHQDFISFPSTGTKIEYQKFLFSIHKNEIESWIVEYEKQNQSTNLITIKKEQSKQTNTSSKENEEEEEIEDEIEQPPPSQITKITTNEEESKEDLMEEED